MRLFFFTLTLPAHLWALLAAAALLTAALALWHGLRARRLTRWQQSHLPADEGDGEGLLWPGVTVVVYAQADEVTWLDDHLPLLLGQDYPDYDVMVVADGCDDESRCRLSEMLPQSPLLGVSFLPEATRGLSRRKLALMLGIKGSRKQVVLITGACCRPAGPQWLRLMMRHFATDPATSMVLGYSHPRWRDDRHVGRRYRAFDWLAVSEQWLLSAIGGRPYRGVGHNIAFSRSLFFSHNGYAGSMDLNWGDDDVWVSEVATAAGTRVELSPGSFVTVCNRDAKRAHARAKLRRDFTTRFVATHAPMRAQAVASAANYVRLLLLAATVALGWRYVLALGLALALLALGWPLSIVPCRRVARTLGGPRLCLSVPWLRLWRPIANVIYRLRGLRGRHGNYTSLYD